MSSSDDDVPLIRGTPNGVKSERRVSTADKAKDGPSNGHLSPGISRRMGPVEEMDIDEPLANGVTNGKRKSRGSIGNGKMYKEESSSEEDDVPLSKRRKTLPMDSSDSDAPIARKITKRPPKVTAAQVGEKDDGVPIEKKLAAKKSQIEKKADETAKKIRAEENKAKKRKVKQESDSEDDIPIAKAKKSTTKPTAKTNGASKPKSKLASTPVKKGKGKDTKAEEEGEEEEINRWWENMDQTSDIKWTTLEHNGVVFPPPYEPLPKNVKLIYDGEALSLHPDAEEVATFYGSMLDSEVNVSKPAFNKNFFKDFRAILDKTGHGKNKQGDKVKITVFEKCDFKPIHAHFVAERERKKALSAAEKKAIKAEKDKAEEKYLHCKWDGRKQKVGNFRVEPPGLFRGRGDHPKTGKVKTRVAPEQVIINIGKEAKVPDPPAGHQWKEIRHDRTATWLAMWKENINDAHKYVMLAANSDVKGQSDFMKFEKARKLKKYIDKIRKDYRRELKAELMADRQRATAMYLIDKLALRAGNEKGDDEAETVGCCSLKHEHITLKPPNIVVFDFLGKDSIRYHDEVEVDAQVFKNLRIFKKAPKTTGDDIFDRLTTSGLNKHLSTYMEGLTAKVFRTYNASFTMATLLKEMTGASTIPEMVKKYNDANRKVAILCNHKRTVGSAHDKQMEKLGDKINGLRYQQWRMRMQMLDLEPKLKKKKGAEYFARPEDLDDDWAKQHVAAECEEKREKARKKFQKDNEKRAAEGDKPLSEKELKPKLAEVNDQEKSLLKEIRSGKVEADARATVEKLEANYEKLGERIAQQELAAQDKDENKEVALGTSKINYIDPRLTVVFSKKFNVPIEKFFSKTLREKFAWAINSVDEDWEF